MSNIELIKSKLDIVDVVSSYVKELKRAGTNYKANCPFHQEKSPSFTVNQDLQIYKCFGCGKAGDAINFIQEIEKVDFPEALRISAEKAGITLENDSSFQNKDTSERKRIIEANTLAAKYYNYILKTHKLGKKGLEYAIQKRKINIQIIDKFLIGVAPQGKFNLKNFLTSKGFTEKDLIKWGLLVERGKENIDKFRDRLMQPIFNLRGEVIGFSGRYLGQMKEAPKYLNSPETPVYKKNEILYGLYHSKESARKSNFLIIVEGNIDILSSHRVGVENIVAPLGTAFTPMQAKLIKRFADEVYFCFDTDAAGTKALIRGLELAENLQLKHKVIDITGFQDADELIKSDESLWKSKVENARDTIDYLFFKMSVDLDLESAAGKRDFRNRIIPILKLVKDEVLKSHYVKKASGILEISESTIATYLTNSSVKEESPAEETHVENSTKSNLEFYLLRLLVHSQLKVKFPSVYFTDSDFIKIFTLITEQLSSDEILKKLSDPQKKIFEELSLADFNGKELDFKKEIQKTFDRIKDEYIKHELMKTKKLLSINPEDENLLNRLTELSKQRKKK